VDGAALVTAVLDQGGFDVSRTTALSWLQDRYLRAVRKAEWTKAEVSLGSTVADQAEYPLPESALVVKDVLVDGRPYTRVGPDRLAQLKFQAYSRDWVFAPDWTSSAVEQIELYPVPVEDGLDITAVVVQEPTALDDTDASVPVIPTEFHNTVLVDGAIATGLARIDERLNEADRYEQGWEAAVNEMKRLKTSRVGSGPVRFQVQGYHFG
jgi:hypothetical protein